MLKMNNLALENIYREISKKYNTDFIKDLIKIPASGAFLFGGMVRSLMLGKKWHDVDIRMIIDKSIEEREKLVERALKKTSVIKEKARLHNVDLTVYRFMPKGRNSKESVDLSLAPTLEHGQIDFTIHDIFVNLKTGAILNVSGGLQDMQRKVLKTVEDPFVLFKQRPDNLFRAIGFACQLGFTIKKNTYNGLKENAPHVLEILKFVVINKKGLEVETFLRDIFRGLKYDPYKYFSLLYKAGVLYEILLFLSLELNLDFDKAKMQNMENIFPKKSNKSFKENIIIFLTFLAQRLTKSNQVGVLDSIKKMFMLQNPNGLGRIV